MHINNEIAEIFIERITTGLKRKSVTKPSLWAEQYRIMGNPYPGKWTFTHHPWLKEMHDCPTELLVGQKSAQMGFSETALNITFFSIDVLGYDCLYVLPARVPDATDFSASRFNPALELSPHLGTLFSEVQNIGHKRAGTVNLYIRGSRSRGGLKSIPVSRIILDEVDEMYQDNIPLALERTSGQPNKKILAFSTPTIDNRGINAFFQRSTQEHFFFQCPCCSRRTELKFPECLIITADNPTDPNLKQSHLICKECQNRLHHETKTDWLSTGQWVPSYSNRDSRGFHISQLYSCTVKPYEIAEVYLKAQSNPADEQEFYNSKLGLTHTVKGGRVTDEDIDAARHQYIQYLYPTIPSGIKTLGVDVGTWLHYEIDIWTVPTKIVGTDVNIQAHPRLIKHGKVRTFEELDLLILQYGILSVVIDANPEKRKALELANRFLGLVKLCYYGRGISGKNIHISKDEPTITVDRTSWLDLSLGRLITRPQRIDLPKDIDYEYREHLKELVRVYEKDVDGNPIGRYVKGSSDDHYAHARNYAEIALPFALSIGRHEDIVRVL